jgi:UDP-N-acetylmuramoylalanine--D-glutamate ligase
LGESAHSQQLSPARTTGSKLKARPDLPPGPYLVVGLARSGIAAALALRGRGEQVIGLDRASPTGLARLVQAGVEVHLGESGLELSERVGAVVKSPGVPAHAPVIADARARGIPVLGEMELAWRLLPNEFVAVTGTNGKTTTVELIGHIHREAGVPVVVAGNVGVALSGLAGRTPPQTVIACEASSFQLEDTLAFAPEAAVLLNLTPDHLDRHATLESYRQAKLEIFARQGVEDIAVIPSDFRVGLVAGHARRVRFGEDSSAELSYTQGTLSWKREPLLAVTELHLRGRHNVQNAMAAAAVCLARGIDPEQVCGALRSFTGVPHRLEEVLCRDGVLYVNDSKATNVASTLVALEAMESDALPVHLILGGQGKGQDFAVLMSSVERSCRAVYLIGEDAGAIAAALVGVSVPIHDCGELDRAVEQAGVCALEGEVVLLSPCCASFDQFADFEARGERFRELVSRM